MAAVVGAVLIQPPTRTARVSAESPPSWVRTSSAITVGRLQRTYVVVRPAAPSRVPLPVLVVLHGRNMTPGGAEAMTGFESLVGPAIVVYPAGYRESWNAGACCGQAHTAGVDDVKFVTAAVHRTLATQPDASSRAVYLTGYSNGGRLALHLACADPNLFAGVAAVEAVSVDSCPNPHPVSLLEVVSTADPLLAMDAGSPPRTVNGFREPTVGALVAAWRRADGCSGSPAVVHLGSLTHTAWTGCRGGTRLAYAQYAGGSHAWPAGDAATPSAERIVWGFFSHHAPVAPPPAPVPPATAVTAAGRPAAGIALR
ncbi:MAG: PHB depolymerase family esterase [Acidimicrobiales bacterium]